MNLYNNQWKHTTSKRIPVELFNETDTSRLEEAKQNIQKRVSYACNLLKKTLEINVGDEVLIREDIIYEHSSSTWYLPQIQTYGKKL